ncbi:LemA family protein [Mycoplasma hafezii]|uniref:LemA family protein n=1 Tax=Mycoplasma hafezii TaxID=525886 RepID=UPI003CE7BBCA
MANIYDQSQPNRENGFNPTPDIEQRNAKASLGGKIFLYLSFILIIPIIWYIVKNNKLRAQQNKINQLASNIDTQLARRSETLIKLYDTTKGYANFEKSIMTDVTKMRSALLHEQNINRNELQELNSSVFGRLFAVAENYPELKASAMFQELAEQAAYLEREIAASRRLYNQEVNEFNTALFVWPSNVVAENAHLRTIELFQASTKQREDVKLEFNF